MKLHTCTTEKLQPTQVSQAKSHNVARPTNPPMRHALALRQPGRNAPARSPALIVASATVEAVPQEQQQQQQQQQQKQQQQQQGRKRQHKTISEVQTAWPGLDVLGGQCEEDLDYLQALQREVDAHRAAAALELELENAKVAEAHQETGSGSSSSCSVHVQAREQESRATSFAASTKRLRKRQHLEQQQLQQQQKSVSTSHPSTISAARNTRSDRVVPEVEHAWPSADSMRNRRGSKTKLLTRAEECMLAAVARDGLHIEQGAKQLARVLRRQPDDEELARALNTSVRELQQRKHASLAARRMLLQANHGLVVKVIKQFNMSQDSRGGTRLPFEDSMEAGLHGLLRAILKFEPESGFKLSTYAVNWIRQELQRAQRQADLLRLPEHSVSEASQLMRARLRLQGLHSRVPSDEELCGALGWSKLKLAKVTHAALMKTAAAQAMSLESSLDDDGAHDLDARMSMAHTYPKAEDGWKFSSGASRAELQHEEQLAMDMEALLEQVTQKQQQGQGAAPSATSAPALSSIYVRRPGRKSSQPASPTQPTPAPAGAAGQQGEGAAREAGKEGEGVGSPALHPGDGVQSQEGLTPLHVEILRLRLGLMAGRMQMLTDEEEVRRLTNGLVRPTRSVRETPASLEKRAAALQLLEWQAMQGKPASVHGIAAKFKMTPKRVQQAEHEALEWLQKNCGEQIAEILRGHDVDPERAAGVLPRSASGATKKG